jgi:hypothetical protein
MSAKVEQNNSSCFHFVSPPHLLHFGVAQSGNAHIICFIAQRGSSKKRFVCPVRCIAQIFFFNFSIYVAYVMPHFRR